MDLESSGSTFTTKFVIKTERKWYKCVEETQHATNGTFIPSFSVTVNEHVQTTYAHAEPQNKEWTR